MGSLWAHLKSLINPTVSNDIPIKANVLNNFFQMFLCKLLKYHKNQAHAIPHSDFVKCSMFLAPVSDSELCSNVLSLSSSQSLGSDGRLLDIIKNNIHYINHQLTYIFNLSFSQGVFPNLLKNAIVVPIHKNGKRDDPNNYRPISILTTFSKVLEKLFIPDLFSLLIEIIFCILINLVSDQENSPHLLQLKLLVVYLLNAILIKSYSCFTRS